MVINWVKSKGQLGAGNENDLVKWERIAGFNLIGEFSFCLYFQTLIVRPNKINKIINSYQRYSLD